MEEILKKAGELHCDIRILGRASSYCTDKIKGSTRWTVRLTHFAVRQPLKTIVGEENEPFESVLKRFTPELIEKAYNNQYGAIKKGIAKLEKETCYRTY